MKLVTQIGILVGGWVAEVPATDGFLDFGGICPAAEAGINIVAVNANRWFFDAINMAISKKNALTIGIVIATVAVARIVAGDIVPTVARIIGIIPRRRIAGSGGGVVGIAFIGQNH